MKEVAKPSITISEGAQNLFIELLSEYNGIDYKDLPDNIKSAISEHQYNTLISDLKLNEKVVSRFSKLYVLVDYINGFVNGSLGSEAAKSIENNVYNQLKSAMEDKDTAVIVLIDAHYNDKAYLNTREGRHLPVPHANTEEERLIYGKVGELLSKYYNENEEWYVDDDEDGVWFIYKSQFGHINMTDSIDYPVSKSVDKIFNLLGDEDINESDNIVRYGSNHPDRTTSWNHLYETVMNLTMSEFIPDEITIAGVATNICVLSNAIILQTEYPQAEIYIYKDTVASYDADLHNKALDIMEGLGMNVK